MTVREKKGVEEEEKNWIEGKENTTEKKYISACDGVQAEKSMNLLMWFSLRVHQTLDPIVLYMWSPVKVQMDGYTQ